MANRAYLNVVDTRDRSEQEIAEAVYCVPLFWLALFRAPDLQEDSSALSTTVEIALQNLSAALPTIHSMCPDQVGFDLHASALSRALSQTRNAAITADLSEIECLNDDPIAFRAKVRYVLLAFDRQVPAPVGRTCLLDLSGLDFGNPLRVEGSLVGDLLVPE